MDILYNILQNPKRCEISPELVKVANKSYPGDLIVNLPSKTAKSYPLCALAFFLLKSDLPIADYIAECQNLKIQPIRYLDHATIKKDMDNYSPISIKGIFFTMNYLSEKEYTLYSPNDRDIIIISNDFMSPITIDNIKSVLETGNISGGDIVNDIVNTDNMNSTDNTNSTDNVNATDSGNAKNDKNTLSTAPTRKGKGKSEIKIKNSIFRIVEDVSELKDEEIELVKGMFVYGADDENLRKISKFKKFKKNFVIYNVRNDEIGNRLMITNGRVENHEEIMEQLIE